MVTYSYFVKDTASHELLQPQVTLLEIFFIPLYSNLASSRSPLHLICSQIKIFSRLLGQLSINHIKFVDSLMKDFSQKFGFARFNLKCFSCYSRLAAYSVWKIIYRYAYGYVRLHLFGLLGKSLCTIVCLCVVQRITIKYKILIAIIKAMITKEIFM